MPIISINIEQKTYDKLELYRIGKETRTSRSAIVDRAIKDYVNKKSEAENEQKKSK